MLELAQGTRPRQRPYAEQTVQAESCRSLRQSELLSIGAGNEPRPNHDVAQLQTQQSLLDVIARLEIRVARGGGDAKRRQVHDQSVGSRVLDGLCCHDRQAFIHRTVRVTHLVGRKLPFGSGPRRAEQTEHDVWTHGGDAGPQWLGFPLEPLHLCAKRFEFPLASGPGGRAWPDMCHRKSPRRPAPHDRPPRIPGRSKDERRLPRLCCLAHVHHAFYAAYPLASSLQTPTSLAPEPRIDSGQKIPQLPLPATLHPSPTIPPILPRPADEPRDRPRHDISASCVGLHLCARTSQC